MNNYRNAIARCFLPGLVLVSLLSGCSALQRPASHDRDHAFIAYWPPPEGSNRLRVAVKDLIDMKGVVTTAGSEYLAKNSPPAKRDAKCLSGIRRRSVQIVGKTNLTELAVGVSGINAYFGTPKNPLTRRRHLIPGGSSSGSAVAVANGSADIAIGTDTAGSIRVPAACCGVVGLKTTFGLVPLDGVYPIAPTHLDTIGPIAKDVAHTAQGMDLLQEGFAAKYRAAQGPSRSIRIGRLYLSGTDPRIDRAVDEALAAAGFKVVALDKIFKERWDQAQKDGRSVAAASAWIADEKFKSQPGVKPRTRAIFTLGEIEYKTNYNNALKRRRAWQSTLRRVFGKVDFIAVPTLQRLPPGVPLFGGTPAFEALVLGMQNTQAVNLAGNPALAIPVPVHDRAVPLTSLQLIGPRLSEARLLNAGRLIESAN